MEHQVDHGQVNHGLTAVGQRLVVLAQPAVLAEPSERPLDNPTFWKDHKAMKVTAFDDLHGTPYAPASPIDENPRIAPVGPDTTQPMKPPGDSLQHPASPVPILDVGGVDHHRHDQAERIDEDMAFAAFDLLARIVAPVPPFSVLTLWLSKTAALGVGLRPAFLRTRSRRRS